MSTATSTTSPGLHDAASAALDIRALHPAASFLRILGVNYIHVKTPEVGGEPAPTEEAEGDLYLTEYGVPYYRHLMPENWYEPNWFQAKRIRLAGTGTVYRVPTKPLPAKTHMRPSIDLAIKWSRVGQDVPLDTFTLYQNINAEFNTPFEEFALLEELRRGEYGPRHLRIMTQKPLAIYMPSQRLQLWQTGRSREKIMARITRRPGVEIDILRSYILIYGWIKGVDAPLAYPQKDLLELSAKVRDDLETKGFTVVDHKPTHIIVRPRPAWEGQPVLQRKGRVAYAIVDYELLCRTEAHEDAVRSSRRSTYLYMQRDRFLPRTPADYPPELKPASVLDVPYVFGRCESTNGTLWVVGNDPNLFAYFLPERWRLKRVLLSESARTYYTQTKDRIHLIWKVSRLGEIPPAATPMATDDASYQRMYSHGYNTPFEKIALALQMARAGVHTIYPRAIYMTGVGLGPSHGGGPLDVLFNRVLDERRFDECRSMLTPDGRPILPIDHDYITIWGYWRGQDDGEATHDDSAWNPLDAAQAQAKGIISRDLLSAIMARHQSDMAAAGFEDLNLKPDHILLSYIPEGRLKCGPDGFPELRHCNFELVRKIPRTSPQG